MPTLDWIGKKAVVKHHKEVPFRLLEPVAELSLPSPSGRGAGGEGDFNGNLIVQGDNLHALKALLPRYAGQVKCIYIDPPYNTGNEGWVYNDNVNSAEIRKWLGEVVGKEGETLDRHDRWLCMMYPRLLLLKQFLREDGIILISIDDNEQANIRLLMDEIFGEGAFLSQNIVMRSRNGMGSDDGYSRCHDYVFVYKKSSNAKPANLGVIASDEYQKKFKFKDKYGRYKVDGLFRKKGDGARRDEAPNCFYPVFYHPKTLEVSLAEQKGWLAVSPKLPNGDDGRWIWSKTFAADKAYRLLAGKTGKGTIYVKDYAITAPREKPRSVMFKTSYLTERATEETKEIFGDKAFPTPKPMQLIIDLIDNFTRDDDLILDSFAGSGTTGHAVLKLNAEDGGNRRFILVEMDDNIARNVTAERVRRVAQGYAKNALSPSPSPASGRGERAVEGLGGGFQFCTLSSEPLFTAEGQIRADVTFAQLAEFVWFVETGTGFQIPPSPPFAKGGMNGKAQETSPFEKGGERGISSPLLGIHEGRAIYLLYNGILKDKSGAGGNVLTGPVYDVLPAHDGVKVIYAAACRLGAARLGRERIVFKQTPYALAV